MVMLAAPFSLLAKVYDAIMEDIDYEDWARFVLEAVRLRAGARVLDLGCGTGNSTFPFYARGFEVVGLDASADMLRVAREKLPPVRFVQADFTSFCLDESFGRPFGLPFDLVVSMFDSLNNLLEPAHFLAAARRVYEHLSPGGFFMFDVNTTQGLRDLWEAGRAEGWAGDVYYRWEHLFDETTGLARVEAYCESEAGRFTEIHFERPYDPPELRTLLAQAGFAKVRIISYPSGAAATEDDVRVWGVARKSG